MGISTAIGLGTSIAGISLQVQQNQQQQKLVAEQEELTRLQKRISQHQLKQIEDAEKELQNLNNNSNNMRRIGGTYTGMTTRSMSTVRNFQQNMNAANVINNTGLGPIQRGGITGTAAPIMRGGGGGEMIPMQNLGGSLQRVMQTTASGDGTASTSLSSLSSRGRSVSAQSLGGVPAANSASIRMRTPQSIENLFDNTVNITRRAVGEPARLTIQAQRAMQQPLAASTPSRIPQPQNPHIEQLHVLLVLDLMWLSNQLHYLLEE